jgi:hypothetical protein
VGVSTDGILAYGVDIGGPDDEHWSLEVPDEFKEEGESEYLYQLCKDFGCELVVHCSDPYPMYIIAAAKITAWRGHPQQIKNLDVPEGANERIAKALAKLGLPAKAPIWILTSYWG